MTKCISSSIQFPAQKRRTIQAIFTSEPITSDGGTLLLQAAERSCGLLARAGQTLSDDRRGASCLHSKKQIY